MAALMTLLKRSFASFGSDRCATMAAAIAYRTVFSLFPLALLGVSLLGFFVGDESARRQVINGITEVIPLGDEGEQALARALEGTSAAKGWLGVIGILTAAWGASALFGELRTSLNAVWDVDRPRPMLRAKVQDLALLVGFGGLLAASTASTGVLQVARSAGAGWLGPLVDVAGPLFALLLFVSPLVLTLFAFLFLYRFGPHARLTWRAVLPAAAIAALFFEFGKNLLTYYITNLGNFNALAGSLGAAILFLVFVYYAAQVILFAAELSKHRLLVAAGTLPATDPKVQTPKVPFSQKVKGMAVRLWSVGESHHDRELPYEPGRLDPATNRPTNTREEVIVKWEDAEQKARQDAAEAGSAPVQPGSAPQQRPSVHVIAGEARRIGERLVVQSETKVTPVQPSDNARVTRNGKAAHVNDIKAGDWVMLTLNRDGTVQTIDATDDVTAETPSPKEPGGGTDWARVAGMVAPLVVAAFKRKSGDEETSGAEKGRRGRRPRGRYPLLRRKPSS
jgi:membrane protein